MAVSEFEVVQFWTCGSPTKVIGRIATAGKIFYKFFSDFSRKLPQPMTTHPYFRAGGWSMVPATVRNSGCWLPQVCGECICGRITVVHIGPNRAGVDSNGQKPMDHSRIVWSGRLDLNQRPPAPKAEPCTSSEMQ